MNQATAARLLPLISGHGHQFQVVNFQGADYAPQLVAGNSGTLLDNNDGSQPQAFVPDATEAGYVARVHNVTSSTLARCVVTFNPRSMRCAR